MPPMPETTVTKMTMPITMRISLMKISPSGRSSAPNIGQIQPTIAPSTMPNSTCT